jgi:D-threo-aldose 1-dehydrogenase
MSTPLPTAMIGRTGISVTRLGLGTAPLGNWHTPTSDEQAVAVVRAALAAGMNLVDTAPLYGAGLAEQRVGAAIADLPREKVIISTKVGRLVQPDGGVIFDFSRDGVLRSHEASLKRLGVDRIDVLLIHDPDDHGRQALDEAFPALAELRAQGAIGAIGAGMNQWQMLADFARNADFDCFLLAGRYTLLEQTSLEFLELCRSRNIGVFLGGVFNSGILATGPRPGAKFQYEDAPAAVLERAGRIEAVCQRHSVPLATAALQFAAAHPAVTALVLGGVTPLEVETNLRARTTLIPAELWDELRAEGLIHPDAPAPRG